MRPKKSSTLIKRSQTFIKSKQNFNSTQKNDQKKQILGHSSANPEKNTPKKKSGLENVSHFSQKRSVLRTFSRKARNPSQIKQNQNANPHQKKIDFKQYQQKQIDSGLDIKYSDLIIKELQRIRNKQHDNDMRMNVKHLPSDVNKNQSSTVSKTSAYVLFEGKKLKHQTPSSSEPKNKQLNTKRSKMQTESKNMDRLQQGKNSINDGSNLTKSRNINIHRVNNYSIKQKKNSAFQNQPKMQVSSRILKQQQKQTQNSQIKTGIKQDTGHIRHNFNQKQKEHAQRNLIKNQQNDGNRKSLGQNKSKQQCQKHQPNQNNHVNFDRMSAESIEDSLMSSSMDNFQRQGDINTRNSQRQRQRNNRPVNSRLINRNSQPLQSQISPDVNNQIPLANIQQARRNVDLSSLISNTQDIIEFINRLNLRNRTQPFDLMIGQLTQLNLIAQQVQQLGQMGNNLGHSLINVFGTRIRELQTTIINQVGQTLIASFEERMEPEFQALVLRQPSLRIGFSKADIQRSFQQKIAFEEVECSICLDYVKPGQMTVQLQCFHEYHPICIKTWLQNSKKCPLCRKQQIRVQL